jgi:hypothetical protein
MLILLEGPDGGGKTQLGQDLATRGYPYQHNGPPPGNSHEEVFWWQLRSLLNEGGARNYCVDRSWPSGLAYHRYAGRWIYDAIDTRMFERVFWGLNGVQVTCLPPFETAYQCWKQRVAEGKELIRDDAAFATIFNAYYNDARDEGIYPHVTYDYTTERARDLLTRIRDTHADRHVINQWPGLITGNCAATILVVGEQCNLTNPDEPHFPFVGTSRNCRWLAMQFERLELQEFRLAWVNALDPRGETTPLEVLDSLPNLKVVVTLGAIAKRWARSINVATTYNVPHPAYWTRFEGDRDYPLLQLSDALWGDCQ